MVQCQRRGIAPDAETRVAGVELQRSSFQLQRRIDRRFGPRHEGLVLTIDQEIQSLEDDLADQYLRAGRQHGRLGGHGPAANCATASSNCDSSARRTRTFVRSRSPSASETSAGIASMTAPESTTPTPSKARGTPA